MTKRVLGVLAALTMVVGSVACSSSSDATGTPAKDSGADGAKDTGTPTPVDGGDMDAAETEVPTDKTTGLTCMTDDDCDKTGNAIAHCTKSVFAVGPLNPTPICIQFDSSDVCTPTDDMTIHFCDGNMGLCTKSGTNPAMCDAMCVLNADGTWAMGAKCAGNNGCNTEVFGTDSMTMKISMIGTCQGGCKADADCPTGSKCDPIQRFCSKTCTADADCTKGWSSAPANWKCDTTRGACTFKYPKALGDTCSTADDCLCFKNKVETNGYCISLCRAGDSCGTGFTCDALLPAKDDKGAPLFTMTTQPPELVGYCLKNCTADADCPANQMCDASAGLTQKTCRPKSTTATDAGP